MHRNKQRPSSITSSALIEMEFGIRQARQLCCPDDDQFMGGGLLDGKGLGAWYPLGSCQKYPYGEIDASGSRHSTASRPHRRTL
jgi:hypothetical protein